MLALRKIKAEAGLELGEIPAPLLESASDVLIKVAASGICGSDVHAFSWDADYSFMTGRLPITMGHEFCGRVVQSEQPDLAVGRRVAVIPTVGCGNCRSCRLGEERDCVEGSFLGYTRHGGFAEFASVPAKNCIAIPDSMDEEIAALCEPLTIGAEAVICAGIGLGDSVVVLGAGTIGQAAALMAREAGASRVIVAGRDDQPRLSTLRALGFEDLVDVAVEPLPKAMSRRFEGPVDCVIEASGSPDSLLSGLSVLRKGGVLVTAGIYNGVAGIDLTALVRAHQQIRATYRSETKTWFRVIALLAASPEKFRPMITHRLPLSAAIGGMNLAKSRRASKVLLFP